MTASPRYSPRKSLLRIVLTTTAAICFSVAALADNAPSGSQHASSGGSTDLANGIGAYLGYNFNSTINSSFQSQATNLSSSGGILLGVRYAMIPADGFGYMGSLEYDFARTSSSATQNGQTLNFNPSVSIGYFDIPISLAYGIMSTNLYVFAGLNYDLPSGSGPSGFGVGSGGLGFQGGLGYDIWEGLAAELKYRTVNMTLTNSGINSDYTQDWGLALNVVYNF